MAIRTHSRFPVEAGEPYSKLPWDTQGQPRGQAALNADAKIVQDFLAHSRGNRRIRDEHVFELAREMRRHNFSSLARGASFKFDLPGYLRDGHHTVYAIIEATTKDEVDEDGNIVARRVEYVPVQVAWGLTEEEADQIDSIIIRTDIDTLKISTGFEESTEVTPVVNAAIAWDHGYHIDRRHYRPSKWEIKDRFLEEQDVFKEAIDLAKPILNLKGHKGVYVPKALRFHLYLLLKLGEDAREYLKNWVDVLTEDSDAWVKQNVFGQLQDAQASKASRGMKSPFTEYGYQLGLLNECWNRYINGRVKTNVQLGPLGIRIKNNDDYPVPEL